MSACAEAVCVSVCLHAAVPANATFPKGSPPFFFFFHLPSLFFFSPLGTVKPLNVTPSRQHSQIKENSGLRYSNDQYIIAKHRLLTSPSAHASTMAGGAGPYDCTVKPKINETQKNRSPPSLTHDL